MANGADDEAWINLLKVLKEVCREAGWHDFNGNGFLPMEGMSSKWHNFNYEMPAFSGEFTRPANATQGNDPMVMFFTSGTTGYPKIAAHSHKYSLGHFATAKYWHNVDPNGLHFTISDTGWGKSLWGKLYGQWLCEAPTFTFDFDRFHANEILPMFAKYHVTTFCAPPTMYRFLVKEDLSKYDLTSLKYATVAGEAFNPEVFNQFMKATGIRLMEGFGQTETTLAIANLVGSSIRLGSMGKPNPLYDVHVLDENGKECKPGETGEICIKTTEDVPLTDSTSDTTRTRKRPRKHGTTAGITQVIPHGRMRTATSGMSDVLMMLSSLPVTVSDLSRSRASSWNFRTYSSVLSPVHPTRRASAASS